MSVTMDAPPVQHVTTSRRSTSRRAGSRRTSSFISGWWTVRSPKPSFLDELNWHVLVELARAKRPASSGLRYALDFFPTFGPSARAPAPWPLGQASSRFVDEAWARRLG